MRTKKQNIRRRVIAYGSILIVLFGGYVWQPNRFDLLAKPIPSPNPRVDPDSKRLFSKGAKVLLITAHPDDSEFFVGGTLKKLQASGAIVHQYICTDGDKGYYPFSDPTALRKVRREEASAAAKAWGGGLLEFLGFRDGRLQYEESIATSELKSILRREEPDYILSFDPLYPPRASHGDHRAAGRFVDSVARSLGRRVILLQFSTRAANFFVDISKEWPAKYDLLAIHQSQFSGEKLKMISNMVFSLAADDGELSNLELAEGFRATRIEP